MQRLVVDLSASIPYRRFVLIFVFMATALWVATIAHADTQATYTSVGGIISTNTTWTKVNSPYVFTDHVTIAAGVVLTIEPGVIVKVDSGRYLIIKAGAQLQATGTAGDPIVFTSNRDDSYGGDTNGDGTVTGPRANDRSGISGEAATNGPVSTVTLQHVLLRYAAQQVHADGNLILQDSILENYSTGVYITPVSNAADVVIERNTIQNGGSDGIYVGSQPIGLTIANNTLIDNAQGIELNKVTTAQVTGNTFTLQTAGYEGLHLNEVGSGVVIANNGFSRVNSSNNIPVGIVATNSTPQLTNNQFNGFYEPIAIDGGYPQQTPTYSGNTFNNNTYTGVMIKGLINTGVWTNFGGLTHYLDNATVDAGATLTIPAGSTLKLLYQLAVNPRGKLVAVGTEAQPIVFTSLKDDEYGGDSNNDGSATAPEPGNWSSLRGYANAGASTILLQHVLIRYAYAGVSTEGNLTLQDSLVEKASYFGLQIGAVAGSPNTVVVERNLFQNNSNGIAVINQPSSLTITNNTLLESHGDSFFLQKVTSGQVTSNTVTLTTVGRRGVYLDAVGSDFVFANNKMTADAKQNTAIELGIEAHNATPQLTNNQVSGFYAAVGVTDSYPQKTPIYRGNKFNNNTFAGVAVSGNLKTGLWSNAGGYAHFINNATLEAGATLTIPVGTVLKFDRRLEISPRAKLVAIGTAADPIVFTSLQDDEVGGDTNGDSAATTPAPGDWSGIVGDNSNGVSMILLQHVRLRYANAGIDPRGNLTVQDSILEKNSTALQLNPVVGVATTGVIERNLFQANDTGIDVIVAPAQLTLHANAFVRNTRYGLHSGSNSGQVDATGNWWNDAAGPKNDKTNPKGAGDPIFGDVKFNDWLTAAPEFVAAPTTSLAHDDFEPDGTCNQAGLLLVNGALQQHTFHTEGDNDWMRFDATAGQTYRIEAQSLPGSPADLDLEVYAQCETTPSQLWNPDFTPGVRLDVPATVSGPVYLRVINHDPKIAGANVAYGISVRALKPAGQHGALIIMAGRLKGADRLQPNILFVTNAVYNLFKANSYTDDEIDYLASDPTALGYDQPATLANLQAAITTWAAGKVGPDKPLTLYLMDHGDIGTFYVDETTNQRLDPAMLSSWLSQLESAVPGVKITIIIEACHSGSFIKNTQSLSKAGRLVITSTDVDNVAYASANGAQFSDRLLTSLREGYSLYASFWDARYSVQRLNKIQSPWIDANGNGIPNEAADGNDISTHDPGVDNAPADTWAPYIVSASGPEQIVNNSGTIKAVVRDNKQVKHVWAAVYAPSYVPPTNTQELAPENVPTFDLQGQGNDQFSAPFTDFTQKGNYQIVLYAEDNDGLKARLQVLQVNTGAQIFLPIVRR